MPREIPVRILIMVATVTILSCTVCAASPDEKPPPDENEKHASEIAQAVRIKSLFDPLIADPRWPHFSIAYQYYIDDDELKNVGSTSFGETLLFFQSELPSGGSWQIGLQAAVFAIFDLDSSSNDLINADYWVGLPVFYRKGSLSSVVRIFHQSSHLGDEYLLRNRVDRVNLSYEAVNLKVSYEARTWLRLYGGGTYILRKDPDDLKRWTVQYGLELKDDRTYFGSSLKPLAAADFKNREESDWNIDASLRAGVEIESKQMLWNRLHLLLEYFNGYSPHGQFYERSIEYVGLGMHFYF
jgi:hypothetical protein